MIRSLVLLSAAALAACSEAAPTDTPEATAEPAALAATEAPSPLTGDVADGVATPPGLTGQVSALTGDVSDLSVRITDYGTVIDLPADALFGFDKADLTPAAEVELRKAAALIGRGPPGAIRIVGHTDAKGDDAYNQRLSEARAKAVADWFGQQVGVRQRAFEVSGKGESAPIAPNQTADGKDDPAGRAKNRRVEVVIPKA